jgi:hypothetical protein
MVRSGISKENGVEWEQRRLGRVLMVIANKSIQPATGQCNEEDAKHTKSRSETQFYLSSQHPPSSTSTAYQGKYVMQPKESRC